MKNLTNTLHRQLDRLLKTKHVAKGRFVGTPRFWAWLCGVYTPTPVEQAELDALELDPGPYDAIERELAADLEAVTRSRPVNGFHELPPEPSEN